MKRLLICLFCLTIIALTACAKETTIPTSTTPTTTSLTVNDTSTTTIPTTTSTTTMQEALYETFFSSSEGFMTDEIMMSLRFRGPIGGQWGFEFGAVSRLNPIEGSQSMLLQWDPSRPTERGYAFTNFNLVNPGKLVFTAAATNGLILLVQYRTSEEYIWHDASIVTFENEAKTTVIIDLDLIGTYRLQFIVVPPDPAPATVSQIRFDEVVVYPTTESQN